MLPLVLILWLASEIATYLLIGHFIIGASWGYACAGTIGGMLGVRAGINAMTWMFGMLFATPAPRLGGKRTARLMWDEFLAFLFSYLVVVPLERLWMPKDRLPAHSGKTPIVLVHGYGCSRGVWWLLRRRLEAAGQVVASVSLFSPYASIDRLAPQLQQRIEAVCQATGSSQVILLTHSMGGLVARACLARFGRERVAQLVTLAAPHQGTELARIGYGPSAREMTPGSACLATLDTQALDLPATSLRNPYDNYVMPQDNQRHPQMQDIELPAVGHLAMLYDRRVAQLLIDHLTTTP